MSDQRTARTVVLGAGRLLKLKRRKDAVEALGIIAVMIPVLAYIADGQLALEGGPASWFESVNRLTALIGTSLLLVHMVLIARVPWLEKTIGLDKLTSAHKKLGKPVLYLLLAHSITVIISYSIADGQNPIQTLLSLLGGYGELLLAFLGMLLMLVVVVSSIHAARRRLSYEAWYLIHLASYVAVLIAIPHQFLLGSEFLAQPLINTFYLALYIFVFANVIWYRSLQPVVASLIMRQQVVGVKSEANRTTSITIGGRHIYKLRAEAGQFFMLRILTKGMWWRPHPFSVSASPASEVRFTIGNRGDDTALIQDLEVGTRVVLEGPFGVFSESKRTKQHVTLLAAGIGVAPIRALAESMAAQPGDITVVYRITDTSDAALLDELTQICRDRNHNLEILSGSRPDGPGFMPKLTDGEPAIPEYARLIAIAPHLPESDIYVCGPVAWSESVLHALKKLRISNDQIHVEEFSW
jgi:predicted ferric reductase